MKAVGLMSGGLDSAVAAKLMSNLGIEVNAVYFRQPWLPEDPVQIYALAENVGAHFHIIDLGQDYLDMLVAPQYGYGSAFNPCIDCHRFMVRKAEEFMKEIGASFVFTGEVLAQRPMSQNKQALPLVEKNTGLEGYLLRPLSAKLLEETIPEKKGWVDREKLMAINGRSRRDQERLAKKWNITGYRPVGGGCLITEKLFGARMKDFLSWPYRDPQETAVVRYGRYFRLNEDFIAIVGRDRKDNEALNENAYADDHIVRLYDAPGPELLLKGKNPDEKVLALAGWLVQRHSKFRNDPPMKISYKKASEKEFLKSTMAQKLSEEQIEPMSR